MKPPIFAASISGMTFLIYVKDLDHALDTLLAQANNEGHKQAIYYLSRSMIGAEHRYNP